LLIRTTPKVLGGVNRAKEKERAKAKEKGRRVLPRGLLLTEEKLLSGVNATSVVSGGTRKIDATKTLTPPRNPIQRNQF